MTELKDATADFKENYQRFVEKYEEFFTIEARVDRVIQMAEAENDMKLAAQVF